MHREQNALKVANKDLCHQGDVLPEGKLLKTCEFWIHWVALVVKDADIELTTETDWSIVVCGDFDESPVIISVLLPFLSTVATLKKSIKNETEVPINEQTLYYKGEILHDNESLVKCDRMKNGAAVYLAIKPIKINIYRADVDFVFEVEIPKNEYEHWKVSALREMVCSRFGFTVECNHVLAVAGKELTNDMMIKDLPEIKDGRKITFTLLQGATLLTPEGVDNRNLIVPVDASFKSISRDALYKRELRYTSVKSQSPNWTSDWKMKIKSDSKNCECQLPKCQSTPVFKLRELIWDKLSILPHQQKLTIGTTVLEDWDEGGNVLLLCNYPSIYDGVTIELVRVTEGIHVKLSDVNDGASLEISRKSVISSSTKLKIPPPKYINIPNPREMTVHMLMNIMANCGLSGEEIYNGKLFRSGYIPISDNPISSIKWITNGCVVTKTKPSGLFHRKSKKKQQKKQKVASDIRSTNMFISIYYIFVDINVVSLS